MKACRESGGTDSLIHQRGTGWEWVIELLTSRSLPLYPLEVIPLINEWELGGPDSKSPDTNLNPGPSSL
jgi:hypothetical protein